MPATAIPRAPGHLPLLGHSLRLLRDPLAYLRSLPAHGDLLRLRFGPVGAVIVCSPELTRQVLVDDRTFDKGGPMFERAREVLGNGLATCTHDDHRRQRRLTQPAFHPQRIPLYAQTMTEQIGRLTDRWRDGQTIDVLTETRAIAARTVAATLFSDMPINRSIGELIDDFTVLGAVAHQRMFTPPPFDRLPTPGKRRYQQAITRLHDTIRQIIDAHRAGGTDHNDLLSILLTSRDHDPHAAQRSQLSESEVIDQIVTFYIGGTEATAATAAWALHRLGERQDIEDRLHAELDAVLGTRPATYDDLPQLPLTGRIITETLRLYPPLWLITRTTTKDTLLGGHRVPAGTVIVFSPYLLHHQPDVFPDPDRFDPDRFAPSSTDPHNPSGSRRTAPRQGSLIPFGGGARKCIADTFGATEAALALATITARWQLRPVPGPQVRPSRGVIFNPRDLRMRISARTAHSA
ncbi:cytochrome P450 [Streptomyces sp. MZ04]|uniref:cytochrome P450 n=1 Tax=Streptomyces sp. MZ04 TaxID=2559236 RepID=UPI00107E839F|nr:cytochrome P450 [Streptomyces sp. MZ04]TGB10003.1 cytochrome P450 [Streptomyces sp. MZ04]